MRHRYIFCGLVDGDEPISNFRLISSCTKYNCGDFIRVNIPDDLELDHFPGDGYSTTCDKRTLNQLGYDCYFLFKGKWRKFNKLKKYKPCDWFRVLEYIYGLYQLDGFNYTDSYEEYRKEWDDIRAGIRDFTSEEDIVFPPFKEDKEELVLPVNLKPTIADFPHEDWFAEYKKLRNDTESKGS